MKRKLTAVPWPGGLTVGQTLPMVNIRGIESLEVEKQRQNLNQCT